MKYAYEDLSDEQFEKLILFLCQQLLGISTQGFSAGPDGGRDAKFVGRAELHPSKAKPWDGTIIIQAKHTNGHNRNFAESEFFSTKSSNTILGKEIPRIKKLRDSNQLDHYMLFANRRLAGNAENRILNHLAKNCGIPVESIFLCGLEQLEIWMKNFPRVPELADLDPVDSPLIVSPDDLAEVVEALARQREDILTAIDIPPTSRITYKQKNLANNMSNEYAKAQIKRYLKETKTIQVFLGDPQNSGAPSSLLSGFQG